MDHNQNINSCPLCREGQIIPMRVEKTSQLILICDECDSQWDNPESVLLGKEPLEKEFQGKFSVLSEFELWQCGWYKYFK
jgi:hypothetical protein